ncbi:hypothetical protein PVAP13_5KG602407 [Panicum virgatum]|uniref:Uncharacterized protein n=1 Tax=Panicum virgatum TaxID=38727 RepID=A0A8T0SWZ6_PANVG|nr:hypothetical protein PVAP13_5KG602407 [Panicum virgatum]
MLAGRFSLQTPPLGGALPPWWMRKVSARTSASVGSGWRRAPIVARPCAVRCPEIWSDDASIASRSTMSLPVAPSLLGVFAARKSGMWPGTASALAGRDRRHRAVGVASPGGSAPPPMLRPRHTIAAWSIQRPLPRLRRQDLPPLVAPTPVRRLFVRHLRQVAPPRRVNLVPRQMRPLASRGGTLPSDPLLLCA